MSTEAATLPDATRMLAGLRPLLMLVGVAAAVAAGVTVVLWSQGPTYSLLYSNLAMDDTAEISKALDAAQIPYRLDASSTSISVPADRLADAPRLRSPEGPAGRRTVEKGEELAFSHGLNSTCGRDEST